jgi:hypothetical protein
VRECNGLRHKKSTRVILCSHADSAGASVRLSRYNPEQFAGIRFGSKADMCAAKRHVCFTLESDIDRVFRHVCFGREADIRRAHHSIRHSKFISGKQKAKSRLTLCVLKERAL